MWKKTVFPVTLVLIFIVIAGQISYIETLNIAVYAYPYLDPLQKAVSYLIRQFNPELNLRREAPTVAPNTYWLVSDNLWAYKALENYAPEVSNAIKSRLIELASAYNLPKDRQGLPISFKHEAVLGDTVPTPFNVTVSYTLYSNDYTLKTDIANGTDVMEDWQEYADLLLYAALSKHWEGKEEEALELFNLAKNMWDGVGINDKATRADGKYATYKLALLLYASKVLSVKLEFEEELIEAIWRMQNGTTGGIITDYYPSGEPVDYADTNTETTSITVIALTYVCTVFSQNFDEEPAGAVPQGWTVENPDMCSLTVNETVFYGGSGKSARFVDLGIGYSYVGRMVPSQNGVIRVKFAIRAEIPEYFMFYIDDGTVPYDNPNGANIYFMPNGKLAYYDDSGWHYLCSFTVNTWYRIKMTINIPENTYNIYVNGSLEAKGAHFRGFGTVTHLTRMHFGATTAGAPVGYIDEIEVKVFHPVISATIDIKPDTLNLRSKGEWITTYIELPEGYDISDINVSSIALNYTVPAKLRPTAIGDYDNDSVPDLMVKFDRNEAIQVILDNIDLEELYQQKIMTVTLIITGKLNDGTPFQGRDIIKIVFPMLRRNRAFLI